MLPKLYQPLILSALKHVVNLVGASLMVSRHHFNLHFSQCLITSKISPMCSYIFYFLEEKWALGYLKILSVILKNH